MSHVDNLLLKQLQAGAYAENDITDVPTGYIFTKEDIDIISPIIKDSLIKSGLNVTSDIFQKKVSEIFHVNSSTDIHLNLMSFKCNDVIEYDVFEFKESQLYIVPKYNLVIIPFLLPELINYQILYHNIAKEENRINTQIDDKKITLWQNVPNLQKQRKKNIEQLFHINNFLFNSNDSSLAWLKNNNQLFLEQLVKIFGYSKDLKLLQFILDNNLFFYTKTSNNFDDFSRILANKRCDGTFVFNKEILDIMTFNPDEKYMDAIATYLEFIDDNRVESSFISALSFSEKSLLVAQLLYWGETISQKKEYEDYMFRFMGHFYKWNKDGDKYDQEFKKQNYYGLPSFKELWEDGKEYGDGTTNYSM